MLIPLDLPPGMYSNATPYKRRGRWVNGNLVRWVNGSVRAIGGWLRRTNATYVDIPALTADELLEAIRDGFAWRTNADAQNVVFGSNLKLYHLSQIGVVTNVTPAGVTTTAKNAVILAGYGANPYGVGAYGAANVINGTDPVIPIRWAFSNFGELLLTCQRGAGSLFEMNNTTLVLAVVTNAPTSIQDFIVTAERIVLTVGAGGLPRLVKWCDQENLTLWTPALSNQAGEFTLSGSGKLLRVITVLQQYLLIGEDDVHVARYVAPPYVFNFELAARNCGPIAAEAVVGTERFAVWWGRNSFWMYDGEVRQLPCEVLDFLTTNVNYAQVSKITAFTNNKHSEVWWLYQSVNAANMEVDRYVIWNYMANTWYTGRIDRTAGLDSGTLTDPLYVDRMGVIYVHEQDDVLPSEGIPFIRSGEIDLENGNINLACRYIYPDTETFGDIEVVINGRQFPTDASYVYGPYVYNNPTPTRALGRALTFRFNFLNARAELGTMRIDIAPVGTGKR